MSIGVRYDISDRVVIQQFRRVFDFWATIAIGGATDAVVLRSKGIVARAQSPNRLNFQGWIAVDPRASTYLADDEAIAIWIHEIGHLLGLQHNSSPASVMYWLDVDASSKLDSQDLHAISLLHALRPVRISAMRTEALQ